MSSSNKSFRLLAVSGALLSVGFGYLHYQRLQKLKGPKFERKLDYPKTKREGVGDMLHGVQVADPYRWLEDADSKETAEWVAAQNKVTQSYLEQCDTRESIRARLKEVFNYERFSVPYKRGQKYFFYKNDGLQNQDVLFKVNSLAADTKESVLIDPNKLSKDGTAALRSVKFNEDGSHVAYAVSRSGSDWSTIYVRNVETAQDVSGDVLEHVKFSAIAWTHDNRGFFYSKFPTPTGTSKNKDVEDVLGTETDTTSNQALVYHVVGTGQENDVEIYRDPEHPKWLYGCEVSDDGRYLLITVSESTDNVNQLYYARLDGFDAAHTTKELDVVKLIDTFDAEYSYLCNDGPLFWFKTNLNAPKGKVVSVDISKVQKGQPIAWKEVIPENEDVLDSITVLHNNRFVVIYTHDVKHVIRIYDLEGKLVLEELPLPSFGQVTSLSGRRQDSEMFYKFSSFLYPGTTFRYDFKTGQSTVFRETKIKGLDPTEFEAEQVFYPSKDGTKVPMYIIYKKGMVRDGTNPTLLYGYGGFDISLLPSFSNTRLVWADNFNGIMAIANLRGGGEYGEEWHKAGTKAKKQNVFDDFQAAAEYLIAYKFTSPAKLCIQGGSNGGLLVGACINQRPELYGAAVAAVGVMDMLRFHKFTIGHFWCSDYGNADKEEDFQYLYKYSPLHNVRKGKPYPSVMLTTADHDDRVVPLHSFKYASELQYQLGSESYQTNPLIIRIECKAGHGAGKPLSKQIDEYADVYGFMAKAVGARWTHKK